MLDCNPRLCSRTFVSISFTGFFELTFVPAISNFVIGLYSSISFKGTVVVLNPVELMLAPREDCMFVFFNPLNRMSSPTTVDPAFANVHVVFVN